MDRRRERKIDPGSPHQPPCLCGGHAGDSENSSA
jgi:hypothetical protein